MEMKGNLQGKEEWERLKGEPVRAYSYFQHYLTIYTTSNRPYVDVSEEFKKSYKYVESLAFRWKWKARAEAYYSMISAEKIRKHREHFQNFKENTLSQLKAISYIASARIKSIAKRVEEADGDFEKIQKAVGNLPLAQLVQSVNTSAELYQSIIEKECENGGTEKIEVTFVDDIGIGI